MKMKISIKNKLLFYFGSTLLVGLVLSAVVSFLLCEDIIKKETEESLLQAVDRCADKINRVLESEKNYIEALCENEYLQSNDHSIEEKVDYLKKIKLYRPFQEIGIVDRDGRGYSTDGKTLNVSGDQVFQNALKGEVSFSNVLAIGEKKVFCLATPLRDEREEIVGAIIEMENVTNVGNVLGNISSMNELFILDSKGAVIYHSSDKAMAYQFPIEGMKEKSIRSYRRPENGEKSYLAYAPLINGWSVATVSDHSMIVEPLYKYQMILFGTNVGIWIIVSIIIYVISSNMSKHVNEIADHIHDIAMGDYMQPVPNKLLSMRDEMGDVARSLQHMKSEIQEMLSTMKECTNYMNDQIEDLTDDIKKTLQESVESRDVTKEEARDVLKRLAIIEKATLTIDETRCQKKAI